MTNKLNPTFFLLMIFLSLYNVVTAQYRQTIRGVVTDQVSQQPLANATVILHSENRRTISDSNGVFRFDNVPVGNHALTISYVAYKEISLNNLVVNAGKELVLSIPMENSISVFDVTVKGRSRKNKPFNEMSTVSTRAFTVQETQRYAASINDPLRMVTSFPGVVGVDDGNNNIAIRGNAPNGLLWRMEGIDIPNPNHFSMAGASGGGISILSSQLLANSDFVTGAFAAEYGNGLSGVFDLKLRNGNNEKPEYALQAGVLGLNVAAEGPLKIGNKASYLVNYRYSTLSLLDKLGVKLAGNDVTTNFQDLSYNVIIPTKKSGTFTAFGMGGLSTQAFTSVKDSVKWQSEADRYHGKFTSNSGLSAFTHTISLSANTSLRSSVAYSYQKTKENELYLDDSYNAINTYANDFETRKIIAASTVNHKINRANIIRTGVTATNINFIYNKSEREVPSAPLRQTIVQEGSTQTFQTYAQWQSKIKENVVVNTGFHFMYLALNKTKSIEPRVSVKWNTDDKNSIAVAYGLHSQMQPLGVYFAMKEDNGKSVFPNRNLNLSKAHHFVISYSHSFSRNLKLKAETYYQRLFNIAVSDSDTSTFSVVNISGGYITDGLVSKGTGRNYGVELSLEKHLDKGYYFITSTSLYDAKYKALDGVERNTKYNGRYTAVFTGGKEFVSKDKRRTFGINIRSTYAGGIRTTPVDEVTSRTKGETVYREKEAFTTKAPDFFRTDIGFSIKWHRKGLTSTLSLDVQNATNRLNVLGQWYDPLKGELKTAHHSGTIPVLNYKIEF